MSFREKVRNRLVGQPLEDLIIDLKIQSRGIARTRDQYKTKATQYYDEAKDLIAKGDTERAKMFVGQYVKIDKQSLMLQRFVNGLDSLVMDLSNAQITNDIGLGLRGINKSLKSFNGNKSLNVKAINSTMGQVQKEMMGIGMKVDIFGEGLNYESDDVSSKDLDKVMDKMVSEVIAEGPASTLPDAKYSELQKKREELKGLKSDDK
jgi:hypothetical protein